MEDLRQSAPQPRAARDRRAPPDGLAFHARAEAVERARRGPDAVAGACFSARAFCSIRRRPARGSGASRGTACCAPSFAVIFLPDYAGMALDAIAARRLSANDLAPAAPGVGDGAGCPPAREKSATAIHSPQALDPGGLRAPFRRRACARTSGDGGPWPFLLLWALFPLAVIADQSSGQQLARRNFDGG